MDKIFKILLLHLQLELDPKR